MSSPLNPSHGVGVRVGVWEDCVFGQPYPADYDLLPSQASVTDSVEPDPFTTSQLIHLINSRAGCSLDGSQASVTDSVKPDLHNIAADPIQDSLGLAPHGDQATQPQLHEPLRVQQHQQKPEPPLPMQPLQNPAPRPCRMQPRWQVLETHMWKKLESSDETQPGDPWTSPDAPHAATPTPPTIIETDSLPIFADWNESAGQAASAFDVLWMPDEVIMPRATTPVQLPPPPAGLADHKSFTPLKGMQAQSPERITPEKPSPTRAPLTPTVPDSESEPASPFELPVTKTKDEQRAEIFATLRAEHAKRQLSRERRLQAAKRAHTDGGQEKSRGWTGPQSSFFVAEPWPFGDL